MAEISGYSCSGLPNLPRTQQFPWLLPHAGLTICQFTRKTRKVSAARVRPSRRHVAAYREAFSRASPLPLPLLAAVAFCLRRDSSLSACDARMAPLCPDESMIV